MLRFEVAADTFATFREAVQQLQRSAGARLDDDALLLALARHVLGGPRDEERSSNQISLTICSACGSGAQTAAGELVTIDAAVVDMAACDAQHLGELLPLAAVSRAANENAIASAGEEAREGAADPSADVCTTTCQRSGHVHVDAPRPRARPRPRAKQSIPPALRRAVLARDQRPCRVPRCAHAAFMDVHHVEPRAEGGLNEASNLVSLCGAHHRAVHRGELLIERDHDGALVFRHAGGSAYGAKARWFLRRL